MNDEVFRNKLNYHLLDSFVKQTSIVISGHLLVASINIGLFWQQINHTFIFSWAIFLLFIGLLRWFMKAQYQRHQQRLRPVYWWGLFAVSSLLLGLAWFVWCLHVSMVIDFDGIGFSIIVITAAGLVSGAVASTSSSIYSYICFSVPILLPLSVVLLFKGQMDTQGIGLLMVIFFIITLRQVLSINGVLQESIINRLELEKSKEQTEKLAKELYQLSRMDALTSITNRRGFDEALSREWLRAKRSNAQLTLLMIDVDYFKNFNDSLGHLAGDDCLRLIASTLINYTRRAGELIARYGGEEFVIILPTTTGKEGFKIAENICEGIAKLNINHPASGVAKNVTVSIGVYGSEPEQLGESQQLIKLADSALYQAKAAGRNCVRLAESFE
ncbi:MAG: diguanylate cyclase (GGDEF)-like protein [Oleiphilaceae bacterium]|jgi:diguanylate cyclase (GGDEF)-like protein